jgi:hypothetical protein
VDVGGLVAQIDRLPFDRLRANGGALKSCDFPLVLSLSKHEISLCNGPLGINPIIPLFQHYNTGFGKALYVH